MPEPSTPSLPAVLRGLHAGADRLVGACRSVAFWLAVCLPVAYPATLATALDLLPALLAVHAVAVAVGHGHRPAGQASTDREPRRPHAAD